MIDIFIKSFNRPYYLDRCLDSIFRLVTGSFQITILDDGTPKAYLDKIKEKYPSVRILTSEHYEAKTQAIKDNLATGKEINGFQIPTQLWRNAVKNGSEYCIVTEDDVWFTKPINVDELSKTAKEHKISLLKLGWIGKAQNKDWITQTAITPEITSIQPKKLFLASPMIMDWFFYNKFKFFTIGYKLKLFDNYTKLKYWALNSILMGFWQKDYWLYVWKDAYGKVDEKQQLRNATTYYKKHRHNPNFIAILKDGAMQTTLQSSATNSYRNYSFNFDVNIFNHIINQEWYYNRFDALENFPEDFSENYIKTFLKKASHKKSMPEEWVKWAEKFKQLYL